jgi:hypothetical protein
MAKMLGKLIVVRQSESRSAGLSAVEKERRQ